MVPTTETVRNLREGPGYPRHRDYSGFHHGGTDGLIRVELSYPHTNFDRWPGHNQRKEVITQGRGKRGRIFYTHPYDPFISLKKEGDVEWTYDIHPNHSFPLAPKTTTNQGK